MNQSIAGIIFQDGKFLIARRLPSGEMGNRWEFPGGKVDPGETPLDTICREFREEMGVDVTPGKLLTTAEFRNKSGPVSLLAYRVYLPAEYTIVLTEHSDIMWSDIDGIRALNFVDSDMLLLPFLENWCKNEKNDEK